MYTIEEWGAMPADQRRAAIGDMSQIQAAELYAALPENRQHLPRLNRREWMALGKIGQEYLLLRLPDWEADVLLSWTVREQGSLIPATHYAPETAPQPRVPMRQIAVQNDPDSPDSPWSKKTMDSLLLWSCALPIVGLGLFVFNFWRPGKLKQSFGLLAGAFFMAAFVYPFILGFLAALRS